MSSFSRNFRVALGALVLFGTSSLLLLSSQDKAEAAGTENAFDYPYFNQSGIPGNDASGDMATCVTGNQADCEDVSGPYAFDWGYTACPSFDPGCKSYSITYDGTRWGMADPWGYSVRNCTSYVAWQLAQLGANPLKYGNLGDGGDWYDDAPSSARSLTPTYGDAAVQQSTSSNEFGHVAFVDAVNSNNGTITVNEYNYNENGIGDQRTGTPSALGLTEFVSFGISGPPPPPTISSVSPDQGEIGTPVAISGSGLANASSLSFNGVAAQVLGDSGNTIATSVPSGATTGNIVVTTPYGSASAAFTVDSNIVIRQKGSNELLAKSGLGSNWVDLGSLPGKFAVAGNTLAVLTPTGELYSRVLISGNWFNEAGNVVAFAVGPDSLVIKQKGSNELLAKSGLGSNWVDLGSLSGKFAVAGNTLAVLTPTGELYSRVLISGNWFNEAGNVVAFAIN